MPVHLGASGKLKGKVQGDAVIVTLKPRGIKCRFAVNGRFASESVAYGPLLSSAQNPSRPKSPLVNGAQKSIASSPILYSQAVNKTCDARMRSSRFYGIICLDAVAGC